MSFGSILRERRTELSIGLTDMAERLGISAAYWSRIERDLESPPRDQLIERAAAILGVQMDDLYVEARRLPPPANCAEGRTGFHRAPRAESRPARCGRW